MRFALRSCRVLGQYSQSDLPREQVYRRREGLCPARTAALSYILRVDSKKLCWHFRSRIGFGFKIGLARDFILDYLAINFRKFLLELHNRYPAMYWPRSGELLLQLL